MLYVCMQRTNEELIDCVINYLPFCYQTPLHYAAEGSKQTVCASELCLYMSVCMSACHTHAHVCINTYRKFGKHS